MGDEKWSVRRLANRVGMPETSVRRYISELETVGIFITEWTLDRAIIALKAYKGGHGPQAIELLGHQPYIGTTTWLVSGTDTARVFSNLLQATAYIDQHPHGTYHLSPIGTMGLEAHAA